MQQSLEIFNLIFYKFLQTLATFCGVNIFVADYKMGKSGLFVCANIIAAFICTVYTVYNYDLETKLACSSLILLSVQGFAKFITVHIYSLEIRESTEFLRSVYQANSSNIIIESTISIKWSVRFLLMTKIIAGVIWAAGCVAYVIPVVVYFVTGEVIPIAPLYIPYLDENTSSGFTMLLLVQIMWNSQVIVGMIAADCLLALFIMCLFYMIELFENLLAELNYELTGNPNIMHSDEVFRCVSNLVLMHQEICNYLDTVTDIFAVIFFIELNTNAFGLCFIIFSLMAMDDIWYSLYAMFVAIFGKLFMICLLGTLNEIATDRMLDVIQRSKWYLLPTSLQKNFQLMMQRAQNPTVMMAGTTQLNLDTFVNVVKSVYSFTMVLDEMID